jgi:hypothetical protein
VNIPNQPQNGGFMVHIHVHHRSGKCNSVPDRIVRAISAFSMWCSGAKVMVCPLAKYHSAAVETLRGSQRAGLKALHALLNFTDWRTTQPVNIQHHLKRFYLPLKSAILRLIGYKLITALFICLAVMPVRAELSYELLSQLTDSPATLQGEFKQEKYIEAFDTTIISSGQFEYQRDAFIRWNTLAPIENELMMSPAGVINKQGDQELIRLQTDKNPAVKVLSDIFFAVLTAEWQELADYFYANGSEQNKNWQVTLTPKNATLKQVVTQIELSGDELLREVLLHEHNGDITHIIFVNLTE